MKSISTIATFAIVDISLDNAKVQYGARPVMTETPYLLVRL